MTSTFTIMHAAKHKTPGHVADLIEALDATGFTVLENRLRRMAHRQDLALAKARTRDPRATDYGTYRLLDRAGRSVCGDRADIVDVIRYLLGVPIG